METQKAPLVNRVDRDTVLGMISQRYHVRIKAIDEAIMRVVNTVQKQATSINSALQVSFDNEMADLRTQVETESKAFVESIRKKFHHKKRKTPAGIDALTSLNMNDIGAGIRLVVANRQHSKARIKTALEAAEWIYDNNRYVSDLYNSKVSLASRASRLEDLLNGSTHETKDPTIIELIAMILGQCGKEDQRPKKLKDLGITGGAEARPSVMLKADTQGFQSHSQDALRLVENPDKILQVKFSNIPANAEEVKKAKVQVAAALEGIKKLCAQRNALTQEFNDVTVRFTIVRTPEQIMAIAQELGLISKSEAYNVLPQYTEAAHVELLGNVSKAIHDAGLKALPAPQESVVVDAEIIDED